MRGNDDVPDYFISAPQLFDITGGRIKSFFQNDNTREEDFDLVPNGGVTLLSCSLNVRAWRSRLETNLAISTIGEDSLKGRFERSEFLRGLIRNTTTDVDTLRGCALMGSLRNWWTLIQHRHRKPSDSYPSIVRLARFLQCR